MKKYWQILKTDLGDLLNSKDKSENLQRLVAIGYSALTIFCLIVIGTSEDQELVQNYQIALIAMTGTISIALCLEEKEAQQ